MNSSREELWLRRWRLFTIAGFLASMPMEVWNLGEPGGFLPGGNLRGYEVVLLSFTVLMIGGVAFLFACAAHLLVVLVAFPYGLRKWPGWLVLILVLLALGGVLTGLAFCVTPEVAGGFAVWSISILSACLCAFFESASEAELPNSNIRGGVAQKTRPGASESAHKEVFDP